VLHIKTSDNQRRGCRGSYRLDQDHAHPDISLNASNATVHDGGLPICSRTMYSAYQSGQFSSC
jgi:hypothetical protein